MVSETSLLPRAALFGEDHNVFREQVRRFVEQEISPFIAEWETNGRVSKELWRKAGQTGLLCSDLPEEYGGAGADWLYNVIVLEELGRAGATGPGFYVHSEMATPYVFQFGSEEMKRKWLPKMASGEAISGIAMTEPGAGSDLRSIKSRAKRSNNGWILSGQKVFISNGQIGDVFIVAAKTGDTDRISLFLVDATLPGFRRGRNLKKVGVKANDTSELFFEDVPLSADDLIGEEANGFKYLLHGLVRERLTICVQCQARAEAAVGGTINYVKDRALFGRTLDKFQNTQFRLAEFMTELAAGRALVDRLIQLYMHSELDQVAAAAGKLWVTEMLNRVVDGCLQLHGGWGYMWEYPIARAWADARVDRIAGGSSEVMKEIISRKILP